ncbi:MAG: hypothetical protein Q4G58_00980 [bacterium]|nr:hypothetical protein [bacterium]
MTNQQKIAILSEKLHILSENGNDNLGICRKLAREIRNLEKK